MAGGEERVLGLGRPITVGICMRRVVPWSLAGTLASLIASTTGAAQPVTPASSPVQSVPSSTTPAIDRSSLPIGSGSFRGVIGDTPATSRGSWPVRAVAPTGAPNVVLVMTDDVGFGATSTFGGPIPTPNLDRLAAMGLRYTRFHTTAVCSPSRASLLTGRNHHAVGGGELSDTPTPYPGYDAVIPRSAATLARVLQGNGYNTAFFGKDHNIPPYAQSAAGPFDQWPQGLGFDYFYGFVGGDVDQWHPRLYRNTTLADGGLVSGGGGDRSGELLDKRLVDDAIGWLHNQNAAAPDKPFLLYWAPGSGHAPHQAPADWIARFRGTFDGGWDQLRAATFARQKQLGIVPGDAAITARPDELPAWDTLSPAMKRVNARQMEVYAASIAYQDAQFGRLVDELKRTGQLDNTLVIFIEGDNGASAEIGPRPSENEIGTITNKMAESDEQFLSRIDRSGGPDTYQIYSTGWAYALNAPFPWFKHIPSHLGGTRNGLVVAWPGHIAGGGTRTAFSHLNDIMPTILDAAHIPAPTTVDGVPQQRIDGVSLVPTFTDAAADNHHTQYFELMGNRAIYHDGWMASTTPLRMPWMRAAGTIAAAIPAWRELYDLNHDFTQSHNLAAEQPDKLQELARLWDAEARRNNVYPIDARPLGARATEARAMMPNPGRRQFRYWGKEVSVAQVAAPQLGPRSFTLTATVDVPRARTSGVLLATGSRFGGWAFFLKNGIPVALEAASQLPGDTFRVAAARPLPAGRVTLQYAFTSDGGPFSGGTMAISANGALVARGRIARTIVSTAGIGETLDVGRDTGDQVSAEYDSSTFPGAIDEVTIELAPPK